MKIVTKIVWEAATTREFDEAFRALNEMLAAQKAGHEVFARTPDGEPIRIADFVIFAHDETKK